MAFEALTTFEHVPAYGIRVCRQHKVAVFGTTVASHSKARHSDVRHGKRLLFTEQAHQLVQDGSFVAMIEEVQFGDAPGPAKSSHKTEGCFRIVSSG